MIFDFPFDLFFHPDYDKEIPVCGWEKSCHLGCVYYETDFNGVSLWVTKNDGDYIVKIHNGSTSSVTGFWEIRFPWQKNESCFTFVPGIYYDGNYHHDLFDIPVLDLPNKPQFNASFSAVSFPCVMYKEENVGYGYKISSKSAAGWNGVCLNAEKKYCGITVPAMEKEQYRWRQFDASPRPPYTLYPRSVLSVRISATKFECDSVKELFHRYFTDFVCKELEKSVNTPKIPEEKAAELIRDWMFERHCVRADDGTPLILNAFTDIEGSWPYKNSMAEWNTMIGWCSGPMTALTFLACGGKYRDFAVSYLDFLSENGNSPSGVKYSVFDGKRWMTKDHPEINERNYDHLRFYCDYIGYLGKAIRFEKENGFVHQSWEKDFALGIDIIKDVWTREKDFGLYWDKECEKVNVYRKGSGCGAFALLALAEGIKHFPCDGDLENIFYEGCEEYYKRCVLSGRCNGGPADIKEADDSESLAALADALVKYYEFAKTKEALDMAVAAAEMFSSWVVCYTPHFPGGSMFENINVCGGVLANVQNRHIGPGICTNSARFLYDLGKYTGNEKFITLYNNIKAAAINCVTSYDGEFYGLSPDAPFKKGMISEQINMSDALGIEGETWRVSTCWPSTAVLLGNLESPDK